MRSASLKKATKDNNQFLETPRSNRQNLKQKQKLSQDIKAKYIQQLQQRNRKLKYEIIKINEMLDQQKQKTTIKKQHKLIPTQSSSDVIKKQLENVYKQIKNYQREINHLQNKQAGGMITDKMSRLENILKQKTKHLDKLKSELSGLTKQSLEYSKKLKNNAGKQELENTMLKYNQEIKVLREKVRQAENKQKMKIQNAKKQIKYIANLENQLIQNNISPQELEQIKRNNIFTQIYNKIEKNAQKGQKPDKKDSGQKQGKIQQQKQQIEQMTIDRYKQLQNQVKLYKKLQLDYDKRLEALQKDKQHEQKQTTTIKSKLQQKQDQIVKLQQQIGQLKSKIKKANLKPNYSGTKMQSAEKPKQKPKMSPTKLKSSAVTKSITDQTHIKYDQKGQVTEKGSRFTDRSIIGKTTDVKIVGVKVWTQKNTFAINGIQCIYKIGDSIKNGAQNINKQAKKYCAQNVMQLADGDYIKNISGHISQGNVIQYLVFISKNSIIGRMGIAKQTQKQFNFDIDQDEIPICAYGSISNTKQGKNEGSVIENLGFQITRDKALNKQDKYV